MKIGDNGEFETIKKVEVEDHGYIASTPEVYNGKVYISGTAFDFSKGFMAVVDVASDEYKVNYKVDLPKYSQSTPIVVKDGTDSVKVYFTINTDNDGGIYMIEDSKGATSGKYERIFAPEEDKKNYCGYGLWADSEGTLYYINESRYLFAVGKKSSSDPVKPTQPTTTETKPTTTTQTKPTTSVKTNHKDPDIHKKCKTDMEKEQIRKRICNLCQSWKRKIQKTYNGRKNNKENSHSKIRNILQV
ncbi:MAG: hypothetical protein ACLUTO_06170 [Anaerostipes sp.]